MAMEGTRPQAVSVSLADLNNGAVSLETLEQAFGPESLGIIIVRDLPQEYHELRQRVLSNSSYLANLPPNELVKLENATAKYGVGWSHGKETLANGRYDTQKGSFYAQPIHNAELEAKARELYPQAVSFTTPNVYPEDAILPDFERSFERLCHLIVDVAGAVARNCDRYGQAKIPEYRAGTLEEIVRTSVSTKARLLHYFPSSDSPQQQDVTAKTDTSTASTTEDDWCATHRDLGALTGLTSNMYVDELANPPQVPSPPQGPPSLLSELPTHPDPSAGLWIRDRQGRTTQVSIPRDSLAFQTGEALELLTGGRFQAVPHFVRGGKGGGGGIARNTLAVFTQPNLWEVVERGEGGGKGKVFADVAQGVIDRGV